MINLSFRLTMVVATASIITQLLVRLFVDSSEEQMALRLLGAQTQIYASTLAATPPAERRKMARKLSEPLGIQIRLEQAEGGEPLRSEWRSGRVYIVAQVLDVLRPQALGQIAIGPLPPGPVASLPSALALALLVALVVAALTTWPISKRIRSLESLATRMYTGDFAARTQRQEGDPLDGLGAVLNQLADRIGQLLQDERDLLRTVAHEVRAPISRMRFRVEKIHRSSDETNQKYTLGLVNDLKQVDNLFEELLTYVAFDEFNQDRPKLQMTSIVVGTAVEQVVEEVTATNDSITVIVKGDMRAEIIANRKLFDRAVTNLLLNRSASSMFRIQALAFLRWTGPR